MYGGDSNEITKWLGRHAPSRLLSLQTEAPFNEIGLYLINLLEFYWSPMENSKQPRLFPRL